MLRHILYISILFLILPFFNAEGQGVLIGKKDGATNPFAKLEMYSTNSGLLIPRMTTTQREAIRPDGSAISLLVFDTDLGAFMFFNGDDWVGLLSGEGNDEIRKLLEELMKEITADMENRFTVIYDKLELDSTTLATRMDYIEQLISEIDLSALEVIKQQIIADSLHFEQELGRKVDTAAFNDTVAALRQLIVDAKKGQQNAMVVATLSERPAAGTTLGDMVIISNNGEGFREVFVWADTDADGEGDTWESIDKAQLANGYDVYWFKQPSTQNPTDASIYTSDKIVAPGSVSFSSNGYTIETGENFEGNYILAFPDTWGEPQFTLRDFPIIDGMRMYPMEINGIKYQTWTVYISMTADYTFDLKLKALN